MGNIRKAPKNRYRVVGVDTFSDEAGIIGDYYSQSDAIAMANERGGTMYRTYVYDDQGQYIHSAGTY
jgi:hypothetical protein